jgi:hypothetical protein
MEAYQCKQGKLPGGSNYRRVMKAARLEYHTLQSNPRRRTYIKAQYFDKEKVFIDLFWEHLKQMRPADRIRRLKLYACALELIANCTLSPKIKINPNNVNETLYRFKGTSKEGAIFYVQIKENRKERKDFISIVPR